MSKRSIYRGIWATTLAVLSALAGSADARGDDFERDPIRYSATAADNRVSRLSERLAAGQVRLAFEPHFGYLRALLKELEVPASSQMLVFSKTSLQRQRIAPRTPRALYFSDDVYLGFCQSGEVLEISAVDPRLGTVYYTLEQNERNPPRLLRQGDNCLICHGSSQTQGVPGHLVRSVFADEQGFPLLASGTYRINHTSPLRQRWGGWYVTGTHGPQPHLGNMIVRTREVREPVDNAAGMNRTALADTIERDRYLTGHSDIVALMVLEHQAEGHNLLTRANLETRLALHQEEALNRELKEPPGHRWRSTTARIEGVGDPLVKYLLFSGEAELTARIVGTSTFAADFVRHGPRDAQGRSLRDLDLQRRLFKYPCSYLIYSPSFDALPAAVRDYVLDQIWTILNGKETGDAFRHLSPADRQAIREILIATKPNLPASWRAAKP